MLFTENEIKCNKIVETFNNEASLILKIFKKTEKDNIDYIWGIKIINTIKNENPSFIIERCLEKLWDNKNYIMDRNEKFFLENNIESKYIKDDERKEWLTGLIEFIKNKLNKLNTETKDFLWDKFNILLKLSIEYKLLNKS